MATYEELGMDENRVRMDMDAMARIRAKEQIVGPSVRLRGDEGGCWTVQSGWLRPVLVRGDERIRVPFWRVRSLD